MEQTDADFVCEKLWAVGGGGLDGSAWRLSGEEKADGTDGLLIPRGREGDCTATAAIGRIHWRSIPFQSESEHCLLLILFTS
jgi:hypothetical protein